MEGKSKVVKKKPVDYRAGDGSIASDGKPLALQLYPNKNPNPDLFFQVPRKASDSIKGFLEGKNDPQKDREWKKGRASVTRTNGNQMGIVIDGKYSNWEDLRREVVSRGDAVFIQTWKALCAFAYDHGHGHRFYGAKVTDIMGYVLKKPKSGYFNQEKKQEFTERLNKLASTKIAIDHDVPDGKKTILKKGKGRVPKTKNVTSYIDLLRIEHAEHAKKNEDKSVMVELWGELLPGINKGAHRGLIAGRGIFELDGNKDRTAILLGEHIETRLDQIRQGLERTGKPGPPIMTTTLINLIKWADQGDCWENHRPSIAAKRLKKGLDKLQDVGYFKGYTPSKFTSDPGLPIQIIGYRGNE